MLYCVRTYGPLPEPVDAPELNQPSALSAVSAPTAAVPPCALTSFELTTPVDGFVRIEGSCVAGVADLRTTVYLPFADAVTPSSRKAGLPLRLTRRRNEKTASADVIGVPSAKWTFFFIWKTNVFASFDADHDWTSCGTGCAMSPPLYVKNVSYLARLMIAPVGSNPR